MSVSDNILLKRFTSKNDAEAFAEIIEQYAPLVYGTCLRILDDKDKAADAVQDTFLQLVRDAANISGSLRSWLHRVATHRAIDLVRTDSRQRSREAKYVENTEKNRSREDSPTWNEISVYIDQELDKLDDQIQEVLILRFFEGKTTNEIARMYGVSQPTVSRRIESGVVALRRKLKSRGVFIPAAILTAMLTENAVKAAPFVIMKELGKIALAGGKAVTAATGVKIVAGMSAGAAIKARIIALAAVAVIGISSAIIYYNATKQTDAVIEENSQIGGFTETSPNGYLQTNTAFAAQAYGRPYGPGAIGFNGYNTYILDNFLYADYPSTDFYIDSNSFTGRENDRISNSLNNLINSAMMQTSGTTTSTWDLIRQSSQQQSQPETTENNRVSQSPDAQQQITQELTASENETFTITGQVVDYLARPVEGAEVAVIERKREFFYEEFLFSAKVIAPVVTTDENGLFEVQAHITPQPQREYFPTIVAGKQGLAYAWDEIPETYKDKTHCLLVLEKPCTLTGKVLDHNHKAVPGAKVQAIPKTDYLYRLLRTPVLGPKEWFTAETDSNGNFSFYSFNEDVSCGFYVKAPDLNCTYIFRNISASNGFEVWRDDIELILPQEGKIQGRVVEEETNRPLGSVELLLQPDENREDRLSYLPFTIVTNPDGTFVCDGLAEGQNTIELSQQDSQEADWFAESVKFNVTPNQLNQDIELKVQKGGIIEYLVRQIDTGESLPGRYVYTSNDNFGTRMITNSHGIANQRVPQGQYRAWARRDSYTWQNDEPIVVKDGLVTRVNIELPKPTAISGTVVNADGKPAEDILIEIYPFGEKVYTDKKGRFAAGYEDRFTKQGLYVTARNTLQSLAAIVHINDLTQPVKLSLSPALTVKGKIIDPNGIGIPSARVSLIFSFAFCSSQMDAEILTDAQGLFELKAIPIKQPDFEYRLNVNSAGFAAPIFGDRITIQGEPGTTVDIGTIKLSPTNLTISGTLFDANGLPKPHTLIALVGREQPLKSSESDEQGRFFIKGVAEGPVTIQGEAANAPSGAGFTTAQGGDQDIKVIIGQKLVHTPESSLLGKSLPSMSQFSLSLDRQLTQNKMILLCFADIDQRPSRNTILRLNQQAQELLNRDIYTVFIQAEPIAEQKLIGWIRNNKILPPVGMSQTGILELGSSYSWGVQSLPWLILTDAEDQHNVTAEGFSLNELDEKVEQ